MGVSCPLGFYFSGNYCVSSPVMSETPFRKRASRARGAGQLGQLLRQESLSAIGSRLGRSAGLASLGAQTTGRLALSEINQAVGLRR
jgi:hypothetical protein